MTTDIFILNRLAKMYQRALLFSAVMAATRAQQAGTYTTETKPSLTWEKCTASGSCTEQSGSVVIDSNWRWVHETNGYTNCYTGNTVRRYRPIRIGECSRSLS